MWDTQLHSSLWSPVFLPKSIGTQTAVENSSFIHRESSMLPIAKEFPVILTAQVYYHFLWSEKTGGILWAPLTFVHIRNTMKEQYRLLTDLHQLQPVPSICKLNSGTNSGAWQNGITQTIRCISTGTDYQWKGENHLVKPLKRITSSPLPSKTPCRQRQETWTEKHLAEAERRKKRAAFKQYHWL